MRLIVLTSPLDGGGEGGVVAARPCAWERCDRPGVLAVLVGARPSGATRLGAFCVPHAVIAGGNERAAQRSPVWLDLADASGPGRAVALLGGAPEGSDGALRS